MDDTVLLKLGGEITANNPITIDDGERRTLDVVLDIVQKQVDSGKKVVIVASAHKFSGFGVTDYLEQPLKFVKYMRTLTDQEYDDLSLDGAVLKQVRDSDTIDEGQNMNQFFTGLRRYIELLKSWHETKAVQFRVYDGALRYGIQTIARTIGKRVNYIYKLQAQLEGLPVSEQNLQIMYAIAQNLEAARVDSGGLQLPTPQKIGEVVTETLSGLPSKDLVDSMYAQVIKQEIARASDKIITCGEELSTLLLTQLLTQKGITNHRCSADETGIVTNRAYGNADVVLDPTKYLVQKRVKDALNENDVLIFPGFSGTTFLGIEKDFLTHDKRHVVDGKLEALLQAYANHPHYSITALGRGGSETSAAVVADSAGIPISYWIKSDVPGVLTARPDDTVSDPLMISMMDHRTAIETGAIQARAVEYARKGGLTFAVVGLVELYSHLVNGNEFIGTKIVPDGGDVIGPVLESKEQTYYISESSARYLRFQDVQDREGELARIEGLAAEYGLNLAEAHHHKSSTVLIFDKGLNNLEAAAAAIQEKLGYETNNGDCTYFRLVNGNVTLADKQRFETVVDKASQGHLLYWGSGLPGVNAATCAVDSTYKAAVKKALYEAFILNEK